MQDRGDSNLRHPSVVCGPKIPRRAWGCAVLVVCLAFASFGCEYIGLANARIADIVARPGDYLGHEVVLKGTVVHSLKLGPTVNSYWLADGTGEIRVLARGPVPLRGKKVIVRGEVDCLVVVMGDVVGVYAREIRRRE